jgi:hypothetical protein
MPQLPGVKETMARQQKAALQFPNPFRTASALQKACPLKLLHGRARSSPNLGLQEKINACNYAVGHLKKILAGET